MRASSLLLLEAKRPLSGLKTIPAKTMGIAEDNVITPRPLSSLPADAEDPGSNVPAFIDSGTAFLLLCPPPPPRQPSMLKRTKEL